MGFPCGLADKESTCNAGDLGSIPGLGRSPGEGKSYPTPVCRPGEFPGLYSPWGCKGSDTTGRLSLSSVCALTLARPELPCSPPQDALPSPGPCPLLSPHGFPGADSQELWSRADGLGLRTMRCFPAPHPLRDMKWTFRGRPGPSPLQHTVSPRAGQSPVLPIYTPQLPKKAKQDPQGKLLPSTRQATP